MTGIGDTFQQGTKYQRDQMPRGGIDWSAKPELYKRYPDSQKVQLRAFDSIESDSLEDTIRKRRSVRQFKDMPISSEQLSYLLWASAGISRKEDGYEFRSAPSAGALYPIETYLLVNQVAGVDTGIYHYSVKQHELETLRKGDFCYEVARAALGQEMCIRAAVVFLWTAVFGRSKWKYGQRAYRYIYLDAGHIAENLALAATSIGLGSCQIAALYDDEANAVIDIDGTEESVIYMSVVGNL